MRFEGLDLNLLVAFDIFLEELSVSKAAERLNLSQPATSAALARLREYFKDPILVQHGHRMYATMHAEKLLPHVKALLSTARTITSIPSEFDHTTSSRTFRVGGSDCLIASFFAEFAASLSKTAPFLRFEISSDRSPEFHKLEQGELDLIFAAGSDDYPALTRKPFYEDHHILVGCAKNPVLSKPLTKKTFLELDFIGVGGSGDIPNYGQGRLLAMNLNNSIKLTVPSFAVAPWLLIGTERVSIMPKKLAEKLCQSFDLVCCELPYEFPSLNVCLSYHGARANDEGLMWLVDSLCQSVSPQNIGMNGKTSSSAANGSQHSRY